jgi:hypothetical protein
VHSVNQNEVTATDWHDEQFGHGTDARFARRAAGISLAERPAPADVAG